MALVPDDPVLAALQRIEDKVDRLTYFSGWQSSCGAALTVDQMAEIRRLRSDDSWTDSRGLPRIEDR